MKNNINSKDQIYNRLLDALDSKPTLDIREKDENAALRNIIRNINMMINQEIKSQRLLEITTNELKDFCEKSCPEVVTLFKEGKSEEIDFALEVIYQFNEGGKLLNKYIFYRNINSIRLQLETLSKELIETKEKLINKLNKLKKISELGPIQRLTSKREKEKTIKEIKRLLEKFSGKIPQYLMLTEEKKAESLETTMLNSVQALELSQKVDQDLKHSEEVPYYNAINNIINNLEEISSKKQEIENSKDIIEKFSEKTAELISQLINNCTEDLRKLEDDNFKTKKERTENKKDYLRYIVNPKISGKERIVRVINILKLLQIIKSNIQQEEPTEEFIKIQDAYLLRHELKQIKKGEKEKAKR